MNIFGHKFGHTVFLSIYVQTLKGRRGQLDARGSFLIGSIDRAAHFRTRTSGSTEVLPYEGMILPYEVLKYFRTSG